MTGLRWTWIQGALRARLAAGARRVIWVDRGSEVLVHVDSLSLETAEDILIAKLDLEADEVGRGEVMVSFALGLDQSDRLVAAVQTRPTSTDPLSARWGDVVANALFAALSDLYEASRRQGWCWLLVLALGPQLRRGGRR